MRPISRGASALKRLVRPEKAPLTQSQIAERLGVTQQAVSGWLRGTTRPDHRRMVRIEEFFGVPASEWELDAAADDDTGEHQAASHVPAAKTG